MPSHLVSSVVSRLLNGNKKGKKTAACAPEKVSPTSAAASGLKYPQLEKLEEGKHRKKKSKSVSCFVGESGSPRGSNENLHCIEQIDTEKLMHARIGRKTLRPASCFVETSKDFEPLAEISSAKTIEKPKPLPRKLKSTQRPASCVVESLSQPLLPSAGSSLQTLSGLTSQQEGGENCSFAYLSPQPSHLYEQKRMTYDLKSYFPRANFAHPKPRPRSMYALACDVDATRVTPDGGSPARIHSLLPTLDPREVQSSTPLDQSRSQSACHLPRVRAHPLERSEPLPILRTSKSQDRLCASPEFGDHVEETLEDLSMSPPKPAFHFIQRPRATHNNHKLYKSTDMLATLGQSRSHVSSASTRPLSCFSDESGYLSNDTPTPTGFFGGLSASMSDIYEALDFDEAAVADDELSFRRDGSFRKAHSVSSLLRTDSIQDRSLTVMRKRRLRMKSKRQNSARYSSTETDEGEGDVKCSGSGSTSSLTNVDDGNDSSLANNPRSREVADGNLLTPRTRSSVSRLHSLQMKAWEIRLRRKQMSRRKKSTDDLHRLETFVSSKSSSTDNLHRLETLV